MIIFPTEAWQHIYVTYIRSHVAFRVFFHINAFVNILNISNAVMVHKEISVSQPSLPELFAQKSPIAFTQLYQNRIKHQLIFPLML